MRSELILTVVGIVLLSTVVPLAIFVARNNVRTIRGRLVEDLTKLFSFAKVGGTPLIVPSFELIKYKYDAKRDPIKTRSWLVPVFIFIAMSALGFITALADVRMLYHDDLKTSLLHMGSSDTTNTLKMIGTLSFAFLGGFIWSIQYLIRRVGNFDLRPLSFLRCSIHILLGSFVTAAAWHASGMLGVDHTAAAAAAAFLVGLYPTLMLEKLMARFSYLQLRRVTADTNAICEEIPLDTVLGIDPYIKFRLAEFEIEDIQNLATSNPIALFVETPYGLYEVIDWIAQAQLILAVGTKKTKTLREMNIRTIFDLEKVVFNPSLRRRVMKVLIPEATDAELDDVANATVAPALPWWDGQMQRGNSEVALDQHDALQALVSLARDDLHVMRLRQIWDVIRMRLIQRPVEDAVPLRPRIRLAKKLAEAAAPVRQAAD
jgi:hypothetical protein